MKNDITKPNISALTRIAALGALAFLSISVSPAYAATLSRSVDVSGTPSAVWSIIGPFCAIKDWLPPDRAQRRRAQLFLRLQIESAAGDRLHFNHQGAGQNARRFHRHVEQHLRPRPWQGTGCAGSTDRNLRRRPCNNQSEVCEIAGLTAALAPAAGYDPAAGRRQSNPVVKQPASRYAPAPVQYYPGLATFSKMRHNYAFGDSDSRDPPRVGPARPERELLGIVNAMQLSTA